MLVLNVFSCADDVTVEYNKMKMYYEKLMGCASTVQITPRLDLHTKTTIFESQSGNGRKRVQVCLWGVD